MPIQIPQLDDRNFEQLFAETKARIPVHTPEWTNFNDSDPGITVVQLFAFMTENLLYRSNRIPEANRLKFLSLLGVPLQPAAPARGLVEFRNEKGPIQPWPLDAGVELRAGKVPFKTRTALCILPVTAVCFYKKAQSGLDDATLDQYRLLYETFLERDADELRFYKSTMLEAPELGKPLPEVDLTDGTNGPIDRSLWVALLAPPNVPIDTARAAIARQTLALGIHPSPRCESKTLLPETIESVAVPDPGLIFEIAAPDPGAMDQLAPPRYRRLAPEYAENVLETSGVVMLRLPPYEELQLWNFDPTEEGVGDYPPLVDDDSVAGRIVTWIRIRVPSAESIEQGPSAAAGSARPVQQARLTWVGTNAARVIQAVRVEHERLGVGNGAPGQAVKVANTPVILEGPLSPTAPPAADIFVLELLNTDNRWEAWRRSDDLYAADRDDRAYALDPESGLVSFGDGLRGLRPPLGQPIRASYEYGGGMDGMVQIGAINKSGALPGGFKVENPVPTWGASPGETVNDGERNIPRYLKHRERLVTASDFRDIALRTPNVDVGRVEVLSLFHPALFNPNGPPQQAPGVVTVMVIPRSDPVQPEAPVPDRLFLEAVCAWLAPRRLVTTEVHVRGPIYVPIYVSVGIAVMPGQLRELVLRDVQQAIRDYLSPLIGGPPVPGAADLDPVCTTSTAEELCPAPRGFGWPLNMEVRQQDLEAVATRVPGVRYVDSVRMAVVNPTGATSFDVNRVPIVGLQLPRLAGIGVREGPAEDPGALLGQQPPSDSANVVPVPVLPRTC